MNKYSEFKSVEGDINGITAYVVFGIIGDIPQPDIITSLLQIEPSSIRQKKGDREGIWLISSKNKLNTSSLEKHLDYLLYQLEFKHNDLIEILNSSAVTAYFNVVWKTIKIPNGPILTPTYLRRIANLKAYLSFYNRSLED
ncbi:DUF4279 domain-containing protein [Scytonema hofmannii FACHB-248]|uniref:DUF4279 domain-containing protein n=1 Tax=Scytonema hofmannii FACHB-248 TaxID=1842502 RepID=A0ABR8GWS7_9CYAN|nr:MULTISPECIES: DUF4279 domain-containing protein [Nostocales]MBD2607980.1 DUF4279 domain-containing protein [Scytonema hofmannii FACHB-248]